MSARSSTRSLPSGLYQRASSFSSAREIIRRLSGTAFDPQVVSVFLNIRERVWT
ncbi:MAG TPA: hypothetical protein VJN92_03210 [Candidatus Acidoferrum sp.]|nr:hypothetical protein [Candidatus Acidoferrum sp.]